MTLAAIRKASHVPRWPLSLAISNAVIDSQANATIGRLVSKLLTDAIARGRPRQCDKRVAALQEESDTDAAYDCEFAPRDAASQLP